MSCHESFRKTGSSVRHEKREGERVLPSVAA
jgi:hypothetical protein